MQLAVVPLDGFLKLTVVGFACVEFPDVRCGWSKLGMMTVLMAWDGDGGGGGGNGG